MTCTVVKVESDIPSIIWQGPFRTGGKYYDDGGEISKSREWAVIPKFVLGPWRFVVGL